MARVTSKYQVSIPKALAEQLGIRPGDDLQWEHQGDVLRARLADRAQPELSVDERLSLFDAAVARQRAREGIGLGRSSDKRRGWTRADLYTR